MTPFLHGLVGDGLEGGEGEGEGRGFGGWGGMAGGAGYGPVEDVLQHLLDAAEGAFRGGGCDELGDGGERAEDGVEFEGFD